MPKFPTPWRSASLIGEITRWSLILFALGLAVVAAIAWLADRSAARNLADFGMIDFLQEEIEPALRACGAQNRACIDQLTQNETGGIWRLTDAAGAERGSFSFGLSAFSPTGAGVEACARTEARDVGGFAIFTCRLPNDALPFRVALRPAGDSGSAALVALELPVWARKVDRAIDHFILWRSLRAALIALGVTLAAVLGLALWLLRDRLRRHFDRLGAELDAYRSGAQPGVLGAYPSEIQRLVTSLNRAIDKSDGLVSRQRRNVHKMAHDLRHQLVNLDVAARDGDGDGLATELARTAELVERYLTLVDWIGPAEGQPGLRAAEAFEAARRSFSRRLRATPVEIEVDCADDLELRLHPADLNIILSNLVSNAHRHAAGRIRLSAAPSGDVVRLIVEDDGPGVAEADYERALRWGERLDHAPAGSGFGLAIVAEQVRELYGGETRLSRSPLGGLRVEIDLPRRAY